jgi:hypothetical protein
MANSSMVAACLATKKDFQSYEEPKGAVISALISIDEDAVTSSGPGEVVMQLKHWMSDPDPL